MHSFHIFCRSTSCWISAQERTVPVQRRSRKNSIPSMRNCACTVVTSNSSFINISDRIFLGRTHPLELLRFRERPAVRLTVWTAACINVLVSAGIPIEEEEEDQDTSIKGRLLALLYKIKGPPQKAEKEPEQEQAAPSKQQRTPRFNKCSRWLNAWKMFWKNTFCTFGSSSFVLGALPPLSWCSVNCETRVWLAWTSSLNSSEVLDFPCLHCESLSVKSWHQ